MSSMIATVAGPFKGIIFVFYCFFTSFFTCIFFMGPAYPLLFIKQSWFRRYIDRIVNLLFWLPGALLELVYGVKVIISGDNINVKDCPLIIMNQRSRLDWMFYYLGLQRFGRLGNEKIVSRHGKKLLPGLGWVMQSAMFPFLKRRWEQDEVYLSRLLDYYIDIKYPIQLFLFPEGTNLYPGALVKSHAYAKKNGLVQYEYTLHPRVRGFNYIVQRSRGKLLDTVHDVTVGYKADRYYAWKELLLGIFPEEIHLHVMRYQIENIPTDSDELKQWCKDRWAEKERRLKQFHVDGEFRQNDIREEGNGKKKHDSCTLIMICVLLFWTLFLFASFYAVFNYSLVFWYTILMSVFYVAITIFGNGTDELQLNMHEFKSCDKRKE